MSTVTLRDIHKNYADTKVVTVKLPDNASVTIPVKPGNISIGDTATLGIRPEHLEIDTANATLRERNNATLNGEVLVVERLGGETYLYVRIAGGDTIVVQTHGDDPSHLHDLVPIHIKGDLCHLFNQQGEAIPKTQLHPLTR